jgi:hypothetical protein
MTPNGNIVGGTMKLTNSRAVPDLLYEYPIYDHPDDTGVTEDGISWVRKPPVWDEELENWLKHQKALGETCETMDQYVEICRAELALVK